MKRERGKRLSLKRLCHLRIDLFTDTAAMHIELIGFKEYYGMPRGHKDDPLYSHQYLRSLSGQFLSFSRKRLKWEKKIVVPSLDVITNAFFPRNVFLFYQVVDKLPSLSSFPSEGNKITRWYMYKENLLQVNVQKYQSMLLGAA